MLSEPNDFPWNLKSYHIFRIKRYHRNDPKNWSFEIFCFWSGEYFAILVFELVLN